MSEQKLRLKKKTNPDAFENIDNIIDPSSLNT